MFPEVERVQRAVLAVTRPDGGRDGAVPRGFVGGGDFFCSFSGIAASFLWRFALFSITPKSHEVIRNESQQRSRSRVALGLKGIDGVDHVGASGKPGAVRALSTHSVGRRAICGSGHAPRDRTDRGRGVRQRRQKYATKKPPCVGLPPLDPPQFRGGDGTLRAPDEGRSCAYPGSKYWGLESLGLGWKQFSPRVAICAQGA